MKRTVLFSMLMILAVNVFSQEIKNDSIIVVNGDKTEILINNNKVKIIDSSRGLKISVFSINGDGETEKYPYYESFYENKVKDKTEQRNISINFPIIPTFIKEERYFSELEMELKDAEKELKDAEKELEFRGFGPIYPTIYYSYSAMVRTDIMMVQPQRATSFEWGLYFSQFELCHNKNKTLGLTTAIGISNTYNYFDYIVGTHHEAATNSDNCTYFYFGGDNQDIPTGMENIIDEDINKSYLRYWSLRLPVNIQTQWRIGRKKMAFSFGPEFEWRFAMKSKIKFNDGSKHIVSDNLAYNPFGVNALAILNFQDFVIFGRAGLTYLFNQNNSHENVVPVNLGIGFTF